MWVRALAEGSSWVFKTGLLADSLSWLLKHRRRAESPGRELTLRVQADRPSWNFKQTFKTGVQAECTSCAFKLRTQAPKCKLWVQAERSRSALGVRYQAESSCGVVKLSFRVERSSCEVKLRTQACNASWTSKLRVRLNENSGHYPSVPNTSKLPMWKTGFSFSSFASKLHFCDSDSRIENQNKITPYMKLGFSCDFLAF